ncbi:MAG: hypothetical protein ACKOZW_13775 [Cyanobium sp.]
MIEPPLEPALTAIQAGGFLLAGAAVIGNDALQTLGPFLAANRGRMPRPLQALFLSVLLCAVLWLGWSHSGGDPSWGRLETFPLPERFSWVDLLPPLAVLALTRLGAPVSTTFLVLTAFRPANLPGLLLQSLLAYAAALLSGLLVYGLVGWLLGRPGASGGIRPLPPRPWLWLALQWLATGWLWSQWLIHDLANVYVYLPRQLATPPMALSLVALCGAVGLLVASGGGPIQQRLTSKSHVDDPRAAALITALYGLILACCAAVSRRPLSTTWVFLGLLAGRELGLQLRWRERSAAAVAGLLAGDIARAALGLAVSVAVALLVPALRQRWGLA